jgi:hypothetical protein
LIASTGIVCPYKETSLVPDIMIERCLLERQFDLQHVVFKPNSNVTNVPHHCPQIRIKAKVSVLTILLEFIIEVEVQVRQEKTIKTQFKKEEIKTIIFKGCVKQSLRILQRLVKLIAEFMMFAGYKINIEK